TLHYGKQATISVMAANGGRVRKVLTTPLPKKRFGLGLDSATFSPDGKRIAFVWIKKSGSAIFTIKASGGGLKQVTPWKKGGLPTRSTGRRTAHGSRSPARGSATVPASPRTSS